MSQFYVHPYETWSVKECLARASKINKDGLGTEGGPKGLISHSGAVYPKYGQTREYNGGCIREGNWYKGEIVPLPKIPKSFRFRNILSWGTIIEKRPKEIDEKKKSAKVKTHKTN